MILLYLHCNINKYNIYNINTVTAHTTKQRIYSGLKQYLLLKITKFVVSLMQSCKGGVIGKYICKTIFYNND